MLNIKNTTDGYLKDVEIKGNTVQDAENLADIRSVGDKVEGQELYEIPVLITGKNIFDGDLEAGGLDSNNGKTLDSLANKYIRSCNYIKVKHNASYKFSPESYPAIFKYDKNYKYLGFEQKNNFTTDNSTCYIKFHWQTTDLSSKIQIEEGTQATPYEPYQEDKLTILSPVQLEKVGDVRDRIICKDGVWGVEKNVETVVFDGTIVDGNVSSNFPSDNSSMFYIVFTDAARNSVVICDKFPNKDVSHTSNRNIEGVFVSNNGSNSAFYFRIFNDKLSTQDVAGFKKWLSENNVIIKYKTVNPTFIPLPHDQQVKLRTFAGQTNIHFETEIQGTIKAQVPKSLGATVNTHAEQIGNLSKELDRVKKLEESTVSTVVTDKDFTTVEETSNGYFEDVKLEGRTLVNLGGKVKGSFTKYQDLLKSKVELKLDAKYTFVIKNNTTTDLLFYANERIFNNSVHTTLKSNSTLIQLYTTKTEISGNLTFIKSASESDTVFDLDVVVLEGDHTQNPPSYFEGLMSAGEDVEEISVESVNENLFDGQLIDGYVNNLNLDFIGEDGVYKSVKTKLPPGTYTLNFSKPISIVRQITDNTCFSPQGVLNVTKYVFNVNTYGTVVISFRDATSISTLWDNSLIYLVRGNRVDLTLHQSDKKPLLYFNSTTQTWEKPILRQWDSIEKHSDGKYYYHKRSGEVVLNGSENFSRSTTGQDGSIVLYETTINNMTSTDEKHAIVDKFSVIELAERFYAISNQCYTAWSKIYFKKDEVSDVQGFKQWLQNNPTTVVYKLAQEEVYECTNIDLITYENETNFIVNCGAIAPKSILKVHNNISNVVKILQEKVNLLESNVIASQEVQDMMILESDLRILDIELALMEHMPITLNLGENTMLRSATYFNFLKNHIINETYEKEYLENVINKYLATGRINQDEYDELYKLLYPQNYDIALPIEE